MFFSKKPDTTLYVQRGSLSLYPKTGVQSLPLPDEVYKYLEVRDPKKMRELVAAFASKSAIKGRHVVLLLDKDVLFQKAVKLEADADIQTMAADFEQLIPFDPPNQQAVSYRQKDRLFLFGTNRAMYQLLVEGVEQAGAKVVGVVPAVMFGITESAKLTPARLQQVYDATGLIRSVNFLSHIK